MNNLYQEPLNKRAIFAVFYPVLQAGIMGLAFAHDINVFNYAQHSSSGIVFLLAFIILISGNIAAIICAAKAQNRYRTSYIFPIVMNLLMIGFALLPMAASLFLYFFVPLD